MFRLKLCACGKNKSVFFFAKPCHARSAVGQAEGVSKAGLRDLRRQIDEGATAAETIGTLVKDVMAGGQELLTTEVTA